LSEQRAIASVLGALDDKVRNNERVSDSLADVCASYGDQAISSSTMTTSLAHVCEVVRTAGDVTQPYLGLDDMPKGSTVIGHWTRDQDPTGASWKFEPMDVLFGKLRPYFRKVGVAPIEGRCSREILVIRPKEQRYFGLTITTMASQRFIDHCVAVSTGTRMPRAEWRDISTFAISAPPPAELERLNALATSAYRYIIGLTAESKTLTAIRDALLPKLVSGQIRVPLSNDPEEQIGAAIEALA